MTSKEYEELCTKINAPKRLITVHDLKNTTGRTLLYGYTVERATWHVYLSFAAEIKTVVYEGPAGEVKRLLPECNEQYVPNKSLYPAKCDFEFCRLLKEAGVELPFTTFDKMHLPEDCYGRLLRGDFI